MLHRDAAPGIHRIENAHTNWYIVEDEGRLAIVDTGLPASWRALRSALAELGRSLDDISAVVLTHAHFDHMGFAARAQRQLAVALRAHERELELVAHPWGYEHERPRLPYLRHPQFAAILAEMTAMGALWVKGTDAATPYRSEERLDVPGHPRVVFTPGHTHGHCALHFQDRGAVIAGDAFVMLDPYTGRPGPRVVAGAATADSQLAMDSLDNLAGLGASVALTGHGPPWRGDLDEAVVLARAAGPG